MELLNEKEFETYVRRNYEFMFELENPNVSNELPGTCDVCQREAFLKVHSRSFQSPYNYVIDKLPRFMTFVIECPQCRRLSFITTVELATDKTTVVKDDEGNEEEEMVKVYQFYKLFRLPIMEESFANKDIPNEYSSLKDTVSEASFCLSHSRNIAAAILFRRAIQILAKDVLGATGKTLQSQLDWLKTSKNKLGIDLADIFHENAQIIKDIGNQGAHPDDDVTLHNFSKKDADGLHDLFISIIHEIFVKPANDKALREELKKSRKLK